MIFSQFKFKKLKIVCFWFLGEFRHWLGLNMSLDNEPTWKSCRKAVWMLIQNTNNLAEAKDLLNRKEDDDLHVAFGKCLISLLVIIYFFMRFRF